MKQIVYIGLLLIAISSCKFFNAKKENTTNPFPETENITQQINSEPKNALLYFKRAIIFRKLEQDSLALIDLQKAVQLDSTKANYHSAIGEILFDHKDVTGSTPYFQKALTLNPDDETAHLKMAKLFLFTGEYPKSFTEINTVLRSNVYNAEAYFLKGMCYKGMKDTTKAISSFQTAVQTDPKYVDAHMQLALIHEARKNPLAIQYFENAYKADTSNIEPLYGLGMYWQNQNKYEDAKKVFKRMVGLNAAYPKSYYNIGWMLLQEDSTEKALRQFDMAIKAQPNYAEAYFNRGLCYEILKQNKNAISDYEQVLIFNKENTQAQEALKRIKPKQ